MEFLKKIEINLDNILFNICQIRKKVGKKGIIGVVKSDAYGHGVLEVAKTIQKEVDFFGVLNTHEAFQLIDMKLKKPILILGPTEDLSLAVENDIRITVWDFDTARRVTNIAEKKSKKAIIHVKVDTGMSRLGVHYLEAVDFIKSLLSNFSKNIYIEGIYTHLATADQEDTSFSEIQYKRFMEVINNLQREKINIKLKHIANSAAILNNMYYEDLVRPGIIIYGAFPSKHLKDKIKLRPALKLESKIIEVKTIPKNEGISYGRDYITQRDTRIAVIPIGYADGYLRSLSNKAEVLIKGRRCKVLGRVTMDFIMVDITDISQIEPVKVGDEVVLIGNQDKERISAEELAEYAGTIPYEIFTNLNNNRIKKIYMKGGEQEEDGRNESSWYCN